MSTLYETTRQKLMTAVAAFHATISPAIEVNYPNKFVTDVENNTAPFVTVEVDMKMQPMSLPARHCVRIKGSLILNHYGRQGIGRKIFTDYTDLVYSYFSMKTIAQVTYWSVNPYSNVGTPGYDGVMNVVDFSIEYLNS
jgi:hypothetical protein